ncbi:putative ribonuclease H-like domain-containing protein [Tanacetum coccineum]
MATAIALGIYLAYFPYEEGFQYLAFILEFLRCPSLFLQLALGLFAPLTINLSKFGLEEFQQPEFEGYGPKASKSVYKDTSNEVKKTPHASLGSTAITIKGSDGIWNLIIQGLMLFKASAYWVWRPTKLNSASITFKIQVSDGLRIPNESLLQVDGKSDDGFFVGYSLTSKAFRVYNLENKPIVTGSENGSMFDSSSKNSSDDEPQPSSNTKKKDDKGVSKASGFNDQEQPESRSATLEATHADLFGNETEMDMINLTTSYQVPTTPNTRIHKDHSLNHVIGDIQSGVQTRGMTKNTNEHGFISAVYEKKTHEDLHTCLFACFLSQEEPKRITKALSDPAWVEAMQEELLQFKLQKVWILVDLHKDEVFAPVARIEAIRLFLAYASFMGFMVYQMDVKSAFLYGTIKEEVYVCQPLGFEDPYYPDKVYKVVKALYGLHQAPRACKKGDILLIQIYVDDIIFGSTNKELCTEFEKLMHDKFRMSSMGELNFFLGLQVKEREDGIFISQDKYVAEILKKFCFTDVRTASTLLDTEKPLLKDSDGDDVDVHLYRSMIGSLMYLTSSRPDIINSPFDLVAYSDSDYAGASLDRKSTTGGCQFLGCRLILWQCKKETVVATSSTEAEYVAAASCWEANNVNMQSRMNGRTCNIKQRCGMCQTPRQIKRGRDTKIPQFSGPPEKVSDEVVHKELGDRMERAATTASSLKAKQDSGNNNRTQSMAILNEPSP